MMAWSTVSDGSVRESTPEFDIEVTAQKVEPILNLKIFNIVICFETEVRIHKSFKKTTMIRVTNVYNTRKMV